MKRLLAGAAVAAAMAMSGPAQASDVCAYRVTKAIGFLCPARNGQVLCLPQRPALGNCDRTAWCYGGRTSFCTMEVEPWRGPIPQCPFGSRRLGDGYKCAAKQFPSPPPATATPVFTATAPPTNTPIPTSQPIETGTPVGTATAIPTGGAMLLRVR